MLVKADKKRGVCCIGVTKHGKGFRAMIRIDGIHHNLGTFSTEKDAFIAYKNKKEEAIKYFADKYKKYLDPNVYKALCNYKVEITD